MKEREKPKAKSEEDSDKRRVFWSEFWNLCAEQGKWDDQLIKLRKRHYENPKS